jgi:hypothetical protein
MYGITAGKNRDGTENGRAHAMIKAELTDTSPIQPDFRRIQTYSLIGLSCPRTQGLCDGSQDILDPLVPMDGNELLGLGSTIKGTFLDSGRKMYTGDPDKHADIVLASTIADTYRKYNNATYGYEDYYAWAPEWWKEANDSAVEKWTPARIELCAMTFVDCKLSAYDVTMWDTISDNFYPGTVNIARSFEQKGIVCSTMLLEHGLLA